MGVLGDYLKGLADMVLPRECMVCGRKLGIRENYLCIYCMADFPFTFFWQTERNPMADRLNAMITEEMERAGVVRFEPYAYAAALFFYNSEAGYRHIPHALKYRGNIASGQYFGRLLGEKAASSPFLKDIDLVVPTPLHWTRLLKRGYNQAEIIASAFAKATGAELCTKLLNRKKRTGTQTVLDNEAKRDNVRNAFMADEKVAKRYSPTHIAVIDDVFTTGATSHACYRALRALFGTEVRISVLTLGYVTSS